MKDRAGVVGRAGVNQALQRLRADVPSVRLHLVGHSFGCRVVTAAVTGATPTPKGFVNSMSLLQGAFSHYSFSAKYDDSNAAGFYRNLVTEGRVSGPIIITTHAPTKRSERRTPSRREPCIRLRRQWATRMTRSADWDPTARKNYRSERHHDAESRRSVREPLTKGSMTNLLRRWPDRVA